MTSAERCCGGRSLMSGTSSRSRSRRPKRRRRRPRCSRPAPRTARPPAARRAARRGSGCARSGTATRAAPSAGCRRAAPGRRGPARPARRPPRPRGRGAQHVAGVGDEALAVALGDEREGVIVARRGTRPPAARLSFIASTWIVARSAVVSASGCRPPGGGRRRGSLSVIGPGAGPERAYGGSGGRPGRPLHRRLQSIVVLLDRRSAPSVRIVTPSVSGMQRTHRRALQQRRDAGRRGEPPVALQPARDRRRAPRGAIGRSSSSGWWRFWRTTRSTCASASIPTARATRRSAAPMSTE